MSFSVKPVVYQEAVPLPFWARFAMWGAKSWLGSPDFVLVALVRHPKLSLGLVPKQWRRVLFTVDGIVLGILPDLFFNGVSFAFGLKGVRHVFSVEPIMEPDMIEPVTLEVGRGTIVLLEVWPQTRLLAGRRSPAVKYRIVPSGLTRNGRWGERWARRLGWEDGDG